MMLWYLLKKDILIIKKYVLIMLAAAVLIRLLCSDVSLNMPGFWASCCLSFFAF